MKVASADQIYEQIGLRIVEARKAKGLSQERLATESHVDRSHMGFIEQGRRRPTIATLHRITLALDIKLEDLFRDL
jgi:transcriptional regulator with XRE-family HTH domain